MYLTSLSNAILPPSTHVRTTSAISLSQLVRHSRILSLVHRRYNLSSLVHTSNCSILISIASSFLCRALVVVHVSTPYTNTGQCVRYHPLQSLRNILITQFCCRNLHNNDRKTNAILVSITKLSPDRYLSIT